MNNETIILDLSQVEAVEKLYDCALKPGLINIDKADIREFLKHGKKLILKRATIKQATKEGIERSGLLCDELRKAHKYIVKIEAGAGICLQDIDTILERFYAFEKASFFMFASTYDEHKIDDFQIDLFIMQ